MRIHFVAKLLIILTALIFPVVFLHSKQSDPANHKKTKPAIVKFVNTIVFVKDIEASKRFYSELLGLNIVKEYNTMIIFENGFVIHEAGPLYKIIFKKQIESPDAKLGKDNIDIYFECSNLEALYDKLVKNKIEFIHPIEQQFWGQNVMRLYDPDGHIVEIGKPMRLKFN